MSTECCVRRATLLCFGVVAIIKTARQSCENTHAHREKFPVDSHEALQGPLLGTIPIVERPHMSVSTAVVPQFFDHSVVIR